MDTRRLHPLLIRINSANLSSHHDLEAARMPTSCEPRYGAEYRAQLAGTTWLELRTPRFAVKPSLVHPRDMHSPALGLAVCRGHRFETRNRPHTLMPFGDSPARSCYSVGIVVKDIYGSRIERDIRIRRALRPPRIPYACTMEALDVTVRQHRRALGFA